MNDGCRICKSKLEHVGAGFFACGNENCKLVALIQAWYINDKEQEYV